MPDGPSSYAGFESIEITQADFQAGDDDASSVSQGSIGEAGTIEVSGTSTTGGQLASYGIAAVGGVKNHANDTSAAVFVNLNDGTSAVADTVQYRLAARDKNSNRRRVLTRWISSRESDNSDPRQRPELVFKGMANSRWVQDGKVIMLETKDETAAHTVDVSASTIQLPFIAGYK